MFPVARICLSQLVCAVTAIKPSCLATLTYHSQLKYTHLHNFLASVRAAAETVCNICQGRWHPRLEVFPNLKELKSSQTDLGVVQIGQVKGLAREEIPLQREFIEYYVYLPPLPSSRYHSSSSPTMTTPTANRSHAHFEPAPIIIIYTTRIMHDWHDLATASELFNVTQ